MKKPISSGGKPASPAAKPQKENSKNNNLFLIVVVLIAAAVAYNRFQTEDQKPSNPVVSTPKIPVNLVLDHNLFFAPKPLTIKSEELAKLMTEQNATFNFSLVDTTFDNLNVDSIDNLIGITNASALFDVEISTPKKITPLYIVEHHNFGKCFNGLLAISLEKTPKLNNFAELNGKNIAIINYDKVFNSAIANQVFQSLNIKPSNLYGAEIGKKVADAMLAGHLDYILIRQYFYEKNDQEQKKFEGKGFVIAGKHFTSLPCEIIYTNNKAPVEWLKTVKEKLEDEMLTIDKHPRINSELNINKLIPLSEENFEQFKSMYATGKEATFNTQVLPN